MIFYPALGVGYHLGITRNQLNLCSDGESVLADNTDKDGSDPRWMTLVEAIEHIHTTGHGSIVAAQVQLKKEIGRGVIPVKWADSKQPKIPDLNLLPRSHLVLSGPGFAWDEDSGSLRPLLVLRAAVFDEFLGNSIPRNKISNIV
jgi:hypothetical protein